MGVRWEIWNCYGDVVVEAETELEAWQKCYELVCGKDAVEVKTLAVFADYCKAFGATIIQVPA